MADPDDLALVFLRSLADGATWQQTLDATGLDEGAARTVMADVASRLADKPSSPRRRSRSRKTAEAHLPTPPQKSPFAVDDTVVAQADGASRGNPGPASYGCVYLGPDGVAAFGESATIGVATNNVAEYRGCLAALERLAGWGVRRAVVRLDSQLVVRQLSGQYRVKDATLRRWYQKVVAVSVRFEDVRFEHIPRKENADADRMANVALDALSAS
jgi:ribonuclease HI